jgi:hypothetical protein
MFCGANIAFLLFFTYAKNATADIFRSKYIVFAAYLLEKQMKQVYVSTTLLSLQSFCGCYAF